MTQTHRDRVKEARRKRWEYLRHWLAFESAFAVGAILTLIAVPAFLLCFLLLLILIANHVYDDIAVAALAMTLISGVIASLSVLTCRSCIQKSNRLPYVPPVAEQIAALPAEDVLLRGSDQPTATPEELLRAAQAGTETDAQELLRAERVRSYEQHTDAVQVQQTRP